MIPFVRPGIARPSTRLSSLTGYEIDAGRWTDGFVARVRDIATIDGERPSVNRPKARPFLVPARITRGPLTYLLSSGSHFACTFLRGAFSTMEKQTRRISVLVVERRGMFLRSSCRAISQGSSLTASSPTWTFVT